MNTPLVVAQPQVRMRRPTLRMITAMAFLISALLWLFDVFSNGPDSLNVTHVVIPLVVAAIVAWRRRWTPALPALQTKDYMFAQPEIRAKVGETVTLRLDNADDSTHYLDIDEFNVHAIMPAGKSNVTSFNPTQSGTYTFYCRPHANKATGEGMVGKLIVER